MHIKKTLKGKTHGKKKKIKKDIFLVKSE